MTWSPSIRLRAMLLALTAAIAACTGAAAGPPTEEGPRPTYEGPFAFETSAPGADLVDGATCAAWVRSWPSDEVIPENEGPNETTVDVVVDIDGADERWNAALAPRITGDFTGTTDQILRWGACKWGFDEDITRARAVMESSWRMSTAGDPSDDPAQCDLIGLAAPCAQSYGLLQVKGTVHEGTYPASVRSTAFGVDYALAWLRACYEGSFTWLTDDGYTAGEEWGCVGAWFSGEWWDQPANDYVGTVRYHLEHRTWTDYED